MQVDLADTPLVRPHLLRRATGDLPAGLLTAVVFYAEYIGLGVVLGSALPGSGGAALGTAMVIGAVVVNCLLGAALREPLLAGPRAASIAVLVAGMKFATDHASQVADERAVAMTALTVMLVVASVVQLAGLLPRVRAWVCCTSIALRKGFIFSTAVGMVVGLGSVQLESCFHAAPVASITVVVLSLAAAISWSRWCGAQSRDPGVTRWQSPLAPFSLLIGVAVACAAYQWLIAPVAGAGSCGTLQAPVSDQLVLPAFWLSSASIATATASLPVWNWLVLLIMGALLGLVLLMENLSMLREGQHQTAPARWNAHLKLRALVNLLCAPAGLAPSSLAIVRTNALMASGGRSRLAVIAHGATLVMIMLFFEDWMGALPHLAVAVALVLLAMQMIDEDTRALVWRLGSRTNSDGNGNGHGADNDKTGDTRQSWVFFGVVGVSMACGAVLHQIGWGFGGGPLLALVAGTTWSGWRFMRRRRALARARHLDAPPHPSLQLKGGVNQRKLL